MRGSESEVLYSELDSECAIAVPVLLLGYVVDSDSPSQTGQD
jgi:hypothetical protein